MITKFLKLFLIATMLVGCNGTQDVETADNKSFWNPLSWLNKKSKKGDLKRYLHLMMVPPNEDDKKKLREIMEEMKGTRNKKKLLTELFKRTPICAFQGASVQENPSLVKKVFQSGPTSSSPISLKSVVDDAKWDIGLGGFATTAGLFGCYKVIGIAGAGFGALLGGPPMAVAGKLLAVGACPTLFFLTAKNKGPLALTWNTSKATQAINGHLPTYDPNKKVHLDDIAGPSNTINNANVVNTIIAKAEKSRMEGYTKSCSDYQYEAKNAILGLEARDIETPTYVTPRSTADKLPTQPLRSLAKMGVKGKLYSFKDPLLSNRDGQAKPMGLGKTYKVLGKQTLQSGVISLQVKKIKLKKTLGGFYEEFIKEENGKVVTYYVNASQVREYVPKLKERVFYEPRGNWQIRLYSDPSAQAVAKTLKLNGSERHYFRKVGSSGAWNQKKPGTTIKVRRVELRYTESSGLDERFLEDKDYYVKVEDIQSYEPPIILE